MAFARARRILLCLRWGIGDVVMQTPVLSALRRAAPGAHITAVGAEPATALLAADPRVDEVLAVQRFGLGHWGDCGQHGARARAREWLRRSAFDLVLDPSHAAIGFGLAVWDVGGDLLDTGSDLEAECLRAGGNGLDAIRYAVATGWGLTIAAEERPRLHVGPAERGDALAHLARLGLAEAPLAALSPVASSPLKRWPRWRFAALLRHVRARGLVPLVLAGPERETSADWAGAAELPPLPLLQTATVLQRCRILISNDTGLMHIAAAVGTPQVALFGPTSPAIYLPPGAVAAVPPSACEYRLGERFGPPACVIQGRCLHGGGGCIDTIDPAQVTTLIDRQLQGETHDQ